MYSKTIISIIADTYKSKDLVFISLPISSCQPVLNLIKILTEGTVLSSESESLLDVGKVAQILDIKLVDVQLGSKKKPLNEDYDEREIKDQATKCVTNNTETSCDREDTILDIKSEDTQPR